MNRPELISSVPELTLPERPWKGLRPRKTRSERFPLPPLQALAFEMAVFRALMLNPNRHLYYSRHYTLEKQRWTGAERVARAALRDGYLFEAVEALVLQIATEKDVPEFRLTADLARWVIEGELAKLRRMVRSPA